MLEYIERGLLIPMRFYNVENYKKLLLFRVNSIINHLFYLTFTQQTNVLLEEV